MTVEGTFASTKGAEQGPMPGLTPCQGLEIKDDRFYVAIMAMRNGAMAFMTAMEYRHFPPDTPLNEQFQICVLEWKGLNWFLIDIPKDYAKKARETALELGMIIRDGVPTMISCGERSYFPANCPNVFTLENRERSLDWGLSHKAEDQECEKIMEEARNSSI